ncbi:tetratricopeptide repeat protein [Patescibacteria group bacterium]|nr:tetratricopeptide repeat protein [Patescibacteria group bacterium]
MPLTEKQKKYLKKNLGKRTVSQIIKALGIPELELRTYLAKKLTKEKYDKIFPDKPDQEPQKTNTFSLKSWFLNNRWRIALLAFLVVITYINSLNNDFLSDDINGIVNNKNIGDINQVLSSPLSLVYPFIRYLVVNIFGKVPAAFRGTNILAHLGATITLYLLISLLHLPQIGFLAAALFAVHPLLCESVVWISAGYNPYSAVLILISFSSFIIALEKKAPKLYLLSVFLYFLGLETSEKVIAFPIALFFYLVSWNKIKRHWEKLIPFFVLSIVWGFYLFGAFSNRTASLQRDFYQELPQIRTPSQFIGSTLRQSIIAISSYLGLIVWPKGLTLYHSEMNFSQTEFILMAAVFFLYLAASVYFFRRNKKIFFWLVFFPVILSPTLTPFGISWIVAERYAYLASIGIFVLIATIFDQLEQIKSIKNIPTIIFILLTGALMVRTISRNVDWKNQDNLWLAAAKTSPSSAQNHNNLGDYYARHNQLDQAIEEFQTAIKLKWGYADAFHNLANIYLRKNEVDKATENYQKAIEINPRLWQSYQNLASIFFEQKKYQTAEEYLLKGIEVNPNNPTLKINLATIFLSEGKNDRAKDELEKVLLLDPTNQRAQTLLENVN